MVLGLQMPGLQLMRNSRSRASTAATASAAALTQADPNSDHDDGLSEDVSSDDDFHAPNDAVQETSKSSMTHAALDSEDDSDDEELDAALKQLEKSKGSRNKLAANTTTTTPKSKKGVTFSSAPKPQTNVETPSDKGKGTGSGKAVGSTATNKAVVTPAAKSKDTPSKTASDSIATGDAKNDVKKPRKKKLKPIEQTKEDSISLALDFAQLTETVYKSKQDAVRKAQKELQTKKKEMDQIEKQVVDLEKASQHALQQKRAAFKRHKALTRQWERANESI
ncbi:MAG: hypothetical protein SGARI_007178, partial [Bacillariaceae sp.]